MFEKIRARIALAVLPKSNGDEKVNPFSVLSTRSANVPIYSDMSVRKATREGYKISIHVYRSVRTIVQAASAIPWIVENAKGEPIEGHPLVKVLRKPNPVFSGQDMIELKIAHLLLVGNALWMPVIVGNQVKEFWPVMPDLVKPIPSDVPGEWLKGWKVESQDGAYKVLPPDQFLHFMQLDPGDLYWGTSPLIAAARTIDTDNEAQDTQKISMQNRATPDGVFTHESVLSQEQFEEARRQIRENFLAKTKKREPWVLGAGAKWQQMSMTPIEMDFIASRLTNKRDIAGAFGISPIFLGDLEQSSYNNMMEARKALYEDVVIPMLDDIKATLNLKIAPLYGDIIITYDTSKVAALREDYTKKVEQAKSLWAMGIPFDQINTRLEMGFNEFEGWDTGYLPMQLLPTGSPAREEEPEEEESEKTMVKAMNLRTEEQKTVYWKRVDRRRIGWWGVVSKKMKPLYDAEAKAIDKAIQGKKPDQIIQIAAAVITKGRSEWEKMMTAILSALIVDFGNDTVEALGGEPKSEDQSITCPPDLTSGGDEHKWEFDPTTVATREWIVKHGAEDITSILATNLEDVKKVVLAGVDENLGSAQVARNLRQFYTDRSPYKAMRVARTEVTKASTFGSLEAADQSKIIKSKTWITSRDDRVRDEHEVMDGDTVPLKGIFSNGLNGPEEPMCRCVLSFSTTEVPGAPERKPTGVDWAKSLNSDEKFAVDYWSEKGYAEIRAFQKTGRGRAIIKQTSKTLEDALAKSAPYDGKVYRGLALKKDVYEELIKVSEFKWSAMSSTSMNEAHAASFLKETPRGVILRIQQSSGVNISAASAHASEAEVILARNITYKVTGVHREVIQNVGFYRRPREVTIMDIVEILK